MRPRIAPTSEWVRLSTTYPPRHLPGRGTAVGGGRALERIRRTPPPASLVPLPTKSWGGYSRSKLVRFLLNHPGLALADQRLEIGGLAFRGGGVLLHDRALEGRPRILVDHAQRDREALVLPHLDQHCRDSAVLRVMHDDRAIVARDDLQHQPVAIEREPLGAAVEQHLLARLEPQLFLAGRLLLSEVGEHLVIVHDAILVDFDEARPAVRVRGFQ